MMLNYSVLIIEQIGDEQNHIRDSICQFPEIGLVLCASNAEDGFHLFQVHMPELLIVDMDLEQLENLQVIDQIVQCAPQTVFIMIGEWKEIAFIRHIMHIHTFDYLPKPYQLEGFMKVFSECIVSMKEKQQFIENLIQNRLRTLKPEIDHIVLQTVVTGHEISRLQNYLKFYDYFVCESFSAILSKDVKQDVFQFFIEHLESLQLYVIHDYIAETHVFLICSNCKVSTHIAKQVKGIIDKVNEDDFVLGIGFVKDDSIDYHSSYLEALEEFNEQNVNKIVLRDQFFDDIQNKQLNAYSIRIIKDYLLNNMEAYFSDIRSLSSMLQVYNQTQINIFLERLIVCCETYIRQTYSDYQIIDPDTYVISLDEDHRFLSIHRQLQQIFKLLLQPLHMEQSSTSLKVVQQADAFIRKNYKKHLTLEQLANHINVSTYYICRLFQEHTMMTFIEIVNMYRIEEAKKLLLSEKRIKVIAFEVGFKSSTYFGRVFKQSTDMTPKEYRMKYWVEYHKK